MNKIVEFYKERSISPVHQNITDWQMHCKRREKLYRQLGMPIQFFRNANLLEVGPGGGFNSIVFHEWESNLTLIEPNPTGRAEIEKLFLERKIDNYCLIGESVEDVKTEKTYDIVIAEGFLPTIENWDIVLQKLISLTSDKGVLVITCQDEMGMFIERMKRLVGHIAIKKIHKYEERVSRLVEIFEPQLKNITGMSRPAVDWVQDQLLCEDFNCRNPLTIKLAIQYMDKGWDVLGSSSPQMFEDYSWYKDTEYNYKEEFCRQYDRKCYNLLVSGRNSLDVPTDLTEKIRILIMQIKELEIQYEQTAEPDKQIISQILERLSQIEGLVNKVDSELSNFVKETRTILINESDFSNMEKYQTFFKLFGRSQQYISFVKNGPG